MLIAGVKMYHPTWIAFLVSASMNEVGLENCLLLCSLSLTTPPTVPSSRHFIQLRDTTQGPTTASLKKQWTIWSMVAIEITEIHVMARATKE